MERAILFWLLCGLLGYSQGFTPIGDEPVFDFMQNDVVVYETDADGNPTNLLLNCDVSGDPIVYTWYRRTDNGDVVVDNSYVLENGTFLFVNITEGEYASRDGVVYFCTAISTIGDPAFNATIRSRDITVYYASFGGFLNATTMAPTTMAYMTVLPGAAGIDIAMECRVGESQPPPNIEWFRTRGTEITQLTDDLLEENRWIYVQNVQNFADTYHCEVTNVLVHQRMRSPETFSVDQNGLVADQRFVYKRIGDLTAFGGDMNLMISYVSSNGMDNLQGVFDTVPDDIAIQTSNALGTIVTVPPAPATITLLLNFGAELIDNGSLMVLGRATITEKPMSNRNVVVGRSDDQPQTFSCANTGSPEPTIEWYYNGVQIDSSLTAIRINGDELIIDDPQLTESGLYQCFVRNEISEDSASWLLEVREPVEPSVLPFNESDIGAIRDRQVGALFVRNFTSMVTVPVSVVADPCPSVKWYLNGTQITDGNEFTFSSPCGDTGAMSPFVFMLTVNNLTEATSGSYSAIFSHDGINDGGSGSSPPFYITIPVPVTERILSIDLSVINNPSAMCLLNDSTVDITCETNGFPRPDVQFLEDGNVITPGEGVFQRVSQPFADQIQLSSVQMSDGATYRCQVVGGDSSEASDDTFDFCTRPVITSHNFSRNTIEGSRLTIECEIRGIPRPVVTWLRGSTQINNQNGIDISRPDNNEFISRVTIESASTSDAAAYTCTGTNDAGSVSMVINVEVNGRPFGPLSLEAIIGIAAGGAGLILLIVLVILLLVCVYMCARGSKSGSMDVPQTVGSGKAYTDYSAGPSNFNVDRDSDEEDGGQAPEAFNPEYESLPALRPAAPPMYKPTPSYPHGAPLAGDDLEMVKMPPPDTDSFVGAPPYRRDNGDYRTSSDDFLSEDAQFV